MKYTFLSISIFLITIESYCQDECIIFKKVIDEYVLKYRQPGIKYSSTTLIVLETPNYMRKIVITDFLRYKNQYNKFHENTLFDFIERNQDGLQMDCSKYPKIDIIIVNQEQSKNWEKLLATYPDWNFSILEFSNIGFNEDKTQALLYYGFDSGPGVGGGIYIILEKKRGKWKKKAVIPAWAA